MTSLIKSGSPNWSKSASLDKEHKTDLDIVSFICFRSWCMLHNEKRIASSTHRWERKRVRGKREIEEMQRNEATVKWKKKKRKKRRKWSDVKLWVNKIIVKSLRVSELTPKDDSAKWGSLQFLSREELARQNLYNFPTLPG